MYATGINIHGKKVNLKAQKDFKGVPNWINASSRKLKKIYIPKGVRKITAHTNYIEEIEIPEGVLTLNCYNNLIERITLPDSLNWIRCDRTVYITNLNEIFKKRRCPTIKME